MKASKLLPMTATLVSELPQPDKGWAYEFKWDGVRTIAFVDKGQACLQSRNLLDVTAQYPEVAAIGKAVKDAVLDGEIVTLDAKGRPSFQLLQRRMHVGDPGVVAKRMVETPVAYLVFDVLALKGKWVMDRPYHERRELLESLGLAAEAWQVPPGRIGDGKRMLAASGKQGLEGVMAKRVESTYEPGKRSRAWLKIKHKLRQEMVVGGWHAGSGNREGRLGALLLGYYDGDRLVYAGNVGTGFTQRSLAEVGAELDKRRRDTSPFANPPRLAGVTWVEPELVAEVEFSEWTRDGTLRHPSFKGLRWDKEPRDVVRERAVP